MNPQELPPEDLHGQSSPSAAFALGAMSPLFCRLEAVHRLAPTGCGTLPTRAARPPVRVESACVPQRRSQSVQAGLSSQLTVMLSGLRHERPRVLTWNVP